MARGIGCIEYADGTRRYFVHCETAGAIFPALFCSPAAAQGMYRQRGLDGLTSALSVDRKVEVVRFARLSGWDDENRFNWKFEQFGMATQDAFLEPLSDSWAWGRRRSLQVVNDIAHVAEEIDGGLSGQYDVPLCDLRRKEASCGFNPDANKFEYSEWFGKPLDLCPECASALID